MILQLARRHVRGAQAARVCACRAIDGSAYFEVTPLPDGWYEVAVKVDRAALLPHPGIDCIDPGQTP